MIISQCRIYCISTLMLLVFYILNYTYISFNYIKNMFMMLNRPCSPNFGRYFILKNCSANRPPTEMIFYSMERYCPQNSKKYKTISVGGLRAEQFAIKIDIFYRENFRGVEKSRFKIILILFLYIQSRSGFLQTS